MDSLKQQIRELFEHWRQNTEGSDAVLKSVEYRVLLLVGDLEKTHIIKSKQKIRKLLDALMESVEPLTIGDRELFRDFRKNLLGDEK